MFKYVLIDKFHAHNIRFRVSMNCQPDTPLDAMVAILKLCKLVSKCLESLCSFYKCLNIVSVMNFMH